MSLLTIYCPGGGRVVLTPKTTRYHIGSSVVTCVSSKPILPVDDRIAVALHIARGLFPPRARISTNEQRLRRQGEIFNHDGKCGKIVL